ncbi:tetratricopeptide repeat protein [Gloeobacter morelensis]|uniref:Tetratricopeptide repeat protein n=1 Tax=Gloeobacter morelensis MG652769 TaxID=2781736 RepID=A0ABY3PIJ6_9CYAN|nr:sulfotransferase [Gloeobacter morelensis]UFP93449.1 tetratricopeptide repeat protein [Gloeobacter morelensis MG652769]
MAGKSKRPKPGTTRSTGEEARTACTRGEQLHKQNQLAEAINAFRRAVRLEPGLLEAHFGLGAALADDGQLPAAAASFEQTLRLKPDDFEASFQLAVVYARLGAPGRAAATFQQTLAIRHDHTGAHLELGNLLMAQGDWQRAAGCYRQALAIAPELATAHFRLGYILQQQGRLPEAREHYLRVVALDAGSAAARANLGLICKIEDRVEEAIRWYREALAVTPDEPVILCNLAMAFEQQGVHGEAEVLYRRALALSPGDAEAVAGLASLHEKRREYAAAGTLLAPLADGRTANLRVAIVWGIVCERLGQSERALDVLAGVLARTGPPQDRALLLFRLANLYDALGRYDEAFEHLRQAHALEPITFDPTAWVGTIDAIIQAFSAERLARLPRSGLATERPVFIVGMPRSGTSLVEQILSRHSNIHAAGELVDLFMFATAVENYPAGVLELAPEALHTLARRYLDRLEQLSPSALRVTDKLPQNYLHLGFIALLFPGARIIHCLRDPLDTCLSCHFQNFGLRHPYSGDLAHLGFYYRQYERLMAHWRSVLPLPMLEVSYEALVADPQTISRALVAFCGLEWEESCLRFWESERFVNTASYDQVRRPVYDSSVGRTRHYAAHLGPLRAALEDGENR